MKTYLYEVFLEGENLPRVILVQSSNGASLDALHKADLQARDQFPNVVRVRLARS